MSLKPFSCPTCHHTPGTLGSPCLDPWHTWNDVLPSADQLYAVLDSRARGNEVIGVFSSRERADQVATICNRLGMRPAVVADPRFFVLALPEVDRLCPEAISGITP